MKRKKKTEVLGRRSDRNEGKDVSYSATLSHGRLGEDAEDVDKTLTSVRCEMANTRYIGVGGKADWGDVIPKV